MTSSSWISMVVIASLLAPSVSMAAAASSSGEGGSITIDTLDPTPPHKPIPSGLLRPGMQVILKVNAFDAAGKSITCTPAFAPAQGVTGNQIENVTVNPDGTGILTMGQGFGTAEVKVRCAELPNVEAKLPVANNTLQTPAERAPPSAEGSGSAATGILIGALVAAGVAALVIGLSSSSSPCTHPELWCRSPEKCCPAGYHYYCTTPAAKVGCYNDVFISGCGEKVFCTEEY